MGIKIPDGKGLHMHEQLVADLLLHALGDGDHNTVIGQRTQRARQIETAHEDQGVQQSAEHRLVGQQKGRDIIVDEAPQKQRCGHRGRRTDQNAYQHQKKAEFVAFEHIGEQPLCGAALLCGVLIHGPLLPSSGTHRSRGRCRRIPAAAHGCPWRRFSRRPSPGSCRRPRWRRCAGR